MSKALSCTMLLAITVAWYGCSEKTHPAKSSTSTARADSVRTAAPKRVVPKVIVVNDKVASRSVDGRYYYDLEGRRYWRNKQDGKYYLFNKLMYNNPAFQP